ncbi:MAG: ABC transporter permease, partial [Acidilobaceae archaeon]
SPLMYVLIYFVAVPLLLLSMSPQIGVLTYAFSKSWLGVLPSGFTLDNFQYIFRDDMVVRAIRNSVIYSAIALGFIVFMGVASAYFVNRIRAIGVSLLDFLVMSPLVIPGLSIAMGLLLLYGSGPLKGTLIDPFSNPMILIILAYAIRKSPFTTRAIYAGLQQVHQALEEAGMNLGATRTRVLLGIVVPLIGLNVLAGALISFVYCMTEVSVSIVLGALKPDQAPITYVIFDYLTAGYGGGAYVHVAAAIVALILFVQIVAIFTTNYILKYRYAFLGL